MRGRKRGKPSTGKGGVLRTNPADVAGAVAYLRDRLAEHPAAGYRTRDQAVAEMEGRQP